MSGPLSWCAFASRSTPELARSESSSRSSTTSKASRLDIHRLLEGTFCEVEFAGPSRSDQLLVPIAAVRNHQLFIVNDRERLERRSVDIVVAVGDDVVVTGDLRPGELVVLGDPSPAVEGMLVKTVLAPTTPDRQLAAATRPGP